MSELSYNKYYFIGNALTEEQFMELKYLFQTNRNLVEQSYKVEYLREIFHEFKFKIMPLLIAGIAMFLFSLFLPYLEEWMAAEWMAVIWAVVSFAIFIGTISLVISIFYFLSYLGNKRRYGTLHLYLLENCQDFKSYMEGYLKYAP